MARNWTVFIFLVFYFLESCLLACAPWQDPDHENSRHYGCTATSTWFEFYATDNEFLPGREFRGFASAAEFHQQACINPIEEICVTQNGPPQQQIALHHFQKGKEGFPGADVTALELDRQGNVFVGTREDGLIVVGKFGDAWTQIREIAGKSIPAIHCLCFDSQENLWIGTIDGLYSLSVSREESEDNLFDSQVSALLEFNLKHAGISGFLMDNICLCIAPSPNGDELWIGTGKGLVCKKENDFKWFTDADGLPSNMILSLKFSKDGNLFAGTSEGLAKFETDSSNGQFTLVKFSPPTELASPNPWVYSISESSPDEPDMEIVKTTMDSLQSGFRKRVEQFKHSPNSAKILEESHNYLRWPENKKPDLNFETFKFLENFCNRDSLIYLGTNDMVRTFNPRTGQHSPILGVNLGETDKWYKATTSDSLGRVFALTKSLDLAFESLLNKWEYRYFTDEMAPDLKKSFFQALADPADKSIRPEPTALKIGPDGTMWVGLGKKGLVKFNAVIVDYASVRNAVFQRNAFLPEGLAFANDESTDSASGFIIESPQPALPDTDVVLRSIYADFWSYRRHCPKTIWVGRWFDLDPKEAQKVAHFLGRWAPLSDLVSFSLNLPENPYVIIPRGSL